MRNNILLAVLFFLSYGFEQYIIRALPSPWWTFPLTFIVGILIIHRYDKLLGSAWMFFLGFIPFFFGFRLHSMLAYLVAAILSYTFVSKLFINRSVYALIGLGILTYLFLFLIDAILFLLPGSTFFLGARHQTFGEYTIMNAEAMLGVALGTFVLFLFVRTWRNIIRKLFIVQ